MTTVMGATYPDVYAAIAPTSGAPYGLDASGASAYEEMGPRARPVPAFLLQGVADEISVYPLGPSNLLQWLATDDLADDGRDKAFLTTPADHLVNGALLYEDLGLGLQRQMMEFLLAQRRE